MGLAQGGKTLFSCRICNSDKIGNIVFGIDPCFRVSLAVCFKNRVDLFLGIHDPAFQGKRVLIFIPATQKNVVGRFGNETVSFIKSVDMYLGAVFLRHTGKTDPLETTALDAVFMHDIAVKNTERFRIIGREVDFTRCDIEIEGK